jgi:hypothetical protein
MRIYLDDDSIDRMLHKALVAAGHQVLLPKTVGMSGKSDAEHFTYTIANDLVLLTANYDDYGLLHILIQTAGGHHPGLLLVRKDGERKRDMKPHQIVSAISKLIASQPDLKNHCLVLNPYR